ncbi:MAG TPA: Ig-like domain-containing protein [Verrucomicrobiae bacterium]|nr:Ig-like domain-containing protein [Verrucomicrobiae bacterium]
MVFYEMLTGELPLGKFAAPSKKVHVDVRLDEVVLHALEKEPARRYQHANQVKTDVETIAHTSGATAPPPATAGQAKGESLRAEEARRHVKGPATGLVVTGILNWIGIPLAVMIMAYFLRGQQPSKAILIFVPLIAFVFSGVMIVAGLQMKRLEAYPLAIAGSIFAMLVSPGNLIGLPIGIWSLVVLSQRDVRQAFGRHDKREGATLASNWVLAARWTARVVGTLLLVFFGAFILAEGLPAIASQPEGVQLNFIALGLMLAGFAVGWKREGAAALIIAAGWTLWQISENNIRWNLFQSPLPVALLYGFCWWATRGRKTGTVIIAAVVFALALGVGRAFVPTNIFLRGVVRDAQTGQPIPHAELWLSGSSPSEENAGRPNARAGQDGRFTLYVGWLSDETPVTISASNYQTLTTSFGPRPPHRNMLRDFQLQPANAVLSPATVPPVVVETFPVSGTTEVDSALNELRVTFSKPMRDGGWSWVKVCDETFPVMTATPRFLDERTCALPVKLQPGRLYAVWINQGEARNFQDSDGRAALPYLLIFETRK